MAEKGKYTTVPNADSSADNHTDEMDRENTETTAANTDANNTDGNDNTDEVVSKQPPATNEARKKKPSKERKRKSAWEESGGNKFRNDESCYVYVCTNLCGLCLAYACCECIAKVY